MNTVGFLIGAVMLLVGATMALDLLFEAPLPLARTLLAALLVAWGARKIVHGWQLEKT
jgi:hypothetical protein